MRITIILILTILGLTSNGQGLVGKYRDSFGHSLELKDDSTFRCDWRFDLVHDWATGRWSVSGRTLNLKFVIVYDTLSRHNKPDSLVLSIDEESSKLSDEEFALTTLYSGGQYIDRFIGRYDMFYQRGERLYLTDKNGQPIKSRHKGIWPQKKWPWGYKKWPTFYRKDS